MNHIYIPDEGKLHKEMLRKWYDNIAVELECEFLTKLEKEFVADYYQEAGLLQWRRYPFFRRHFIDSFSLAASYLAGSSAPGVIVDLGCGTGTQSIFLAMRGAKVVGLDIDSRALAVFHKRKAFYEQKSGRTLDIEIIEGDIFKLDLAGFGPFRGVYSMFAFNLMQPSSPLLDLLVLQMVPHSRFVVIDGNSRSLLSFLLPGRRRSVWSPEEFSRELSDRSIKVSAQSGGIVLPPMLWRVLPYALISWFDRVLCGSLLLSASHQVMGEMDKGV